MTSSLLFRVNARTALGFDERAELDDEEDELVVVSSLDDSVLLRSRSNDDDILFSASPKSFSSSLAAFWECIGRAVLGSVVVFFLFPFVNSYSKMRKSATEGSSTCCQVLGFFHDFFWATVASPILAASAVCSWTLIGLVTLIGGLVAIPRSVIEPLRGKRFDSSSGQWTFSNLAVGGVASEHEEQEQEASDDSDILPSPEAALSLFRRKVRRDFFLSPSPNDIFDHELYTILQAPVRADRDTLIRCYTRAACDSLSASQDHAQEAPGTASDSLSASLDHSPQAPSSIPPHSSFAAISNAFSVLFHDASKRIYDKRGACPYPTTLLSVSLLDEREVLSIYFGDRRFGDVFGKLPFSTKSYVLSSDATRVLDERRRARLVRTLAAKLDDRIKLRLEGEQTAALVAHEEEGECNRLLHTSLGPFLVLLSARCYLRCAQKFLGSFDSNGHGCPTPCQWLSGFGSRLSSFGAEKASELKFFGASIRTYAALNGLARRTGAPPSSRDEEFLDTHTLTEYAELAGIFNLRLQVTPLILDATKSLVELDVSRVIDDVCERVFFDLAVDPKQRTARAHALAGMAQLWGEKARGARGIGGGTPGGDVEASSEDGRLFDSLWVRAINVAQLEAFVGLSTRAQNNYFSSESLNVE